MLSGLRRTALAAQRVLGCRRLLSSNSNTNGDSGPGFGSKRPRHESDEEAYNAPREVGEYRNPWYILKQEMKALVDNDVKPPANAPVPRETDICIIGGGAIGSAAAYFLKQRNPEGFTLNVIERDPTYAQAATVLSVGGLRQQFSLEENVRMSMFTADFIRQIKEHLEIPDAEPPDIHFNPQGYLFLASDKGKAILESNHTLQTSLGAKVDKMSQDQLRAKFPWLNTDGITLGTYGVENEGFFDPWLLLCALRNKAMQLGVNYVKGEVVGFRTRDVRGIGYDGLVKTQHQLEHVEILHGDGKVYPMKFASLVNCAGPWSGHIGQLAGIGTGEGAMRIPIPVEPRKRFVFVVHCPDGPGLDCPMLIDKSGLYIRREGLGGHYLCGIGPQSEEEEPDTGNLDVDYEYFHEKVWPLLAHRIPAFESLKLISAWAGYYDYNYFDQNLIIGNHPYHRNMIMATGCSGHGIQQSPAIGRAVMELILDDDFKTIDLSRFSFDRILDDEPVHEVNII